MRSGFGTYGTVMSAHHQQKTLSATFTALEGSEDMIESDISNPINWRGWDRTSDPMINSHLHYRCATRHYVVRDVSLCGS
jgi:hypothetical protein